MAHVLLVNTIGPAFILRYVPQLLPRNGRSVVAVLAARVGPIGDNALGSWYCYRASRAAANQIVRTAATEIGRRHKDAAVITMHPGTLTTPFTSNYPGHQKAAPEIDAENLLRLIESIDSEHSGRFYDWAGDEVPW